MSKITKQFKVFKEGTMDKPVVIISVGNEPFDRDAKIRKYIGLGYNIYDMNDKEIWTSNKN